MALTTTTETPQRTSYSAAYLIAEDVADEVAALLVGGGYRVIAAKVGAPSQVKRFTVQAPLPYSGGMAAGLTAREMQVLTLISHGQSNPEIGKHLFLSEDTVKTHCRRIFRKLGVRDRAHAVAIGYERGLLGQVAA